jgi:hypothetical protein
MMIRVQNCLASLVVLSLLGSAMAFAQTEADRKTIEKARSMYVSQVPASISCDVALDWDGFFQRMKIPMDDAASARVAKLKSLKISFVSTSDKTDVKIDGPEVSQSLSDGLRQQLEGFFQSFWSLAYASVLQSKPDDPFELTKVPSGYLIKSTSGTTKVEMEMDKAYLLTAMRVNSPQMVAAMKTVYKPGADGLFRLYGIDETVSFGETKVVVNMGLDYQTVENFEIPQHLSMSIPGSYSFDYTMKSCDVKASADAPKGKS